MIGSVGIGVALLNQRRQLNAQMFIEFSKRFEDLLRLFPTEAWLANRNPAQALPPASKEVTDTLARWHAATLYSKPTDWVFPSPMEWRGRRDSNSRPLP